VNGRLSNPVYPWLKSRCGPPTSSFTASNFITWNPVLTTDITWNFEKARCLPVRSLLAAMLTVGRV